MLIDMEQQATQASLAALVGVTQPTISKLMADGKIPAAGTLGELLLAYCQRLRDQAAGRLGDSLGLDLVQERAALAREQREDDTVFEQDGVRIFVDAESLALVDGTEIDFGKQGLSETFLFRNPNATAECGCGESFTTDETHR